MPYLIIKILTIRLLTTSLVLNNWALLFIDISRPPLEHLTTAATITLYSEIPSSAYFLWGVLWHGRACSHILANSYKFWCTVSSAESRCHRKGCAIASSVSPKKYNYKLIIIYNKFEQTLEFLEICTIKMKCIRNRLRYTMQREKWTVYHMWQRMPAQVYTSTKSDQRLPCSSKHSTVERCGAVDTRQIQDRELAS